MNHPFRAPILLLPLAAACSSPREFDGPPAAWLAPAGLDDGAITLLAHGEPIDLVESPSQLSEALAVTLALRHSPGLQAQLAQLAAAAAEASQARQWPNPLLSIALRVPEAGGLAQWDLGVSAALGTLLNRSERVEAADARLRAETAAALELAFREASETREEFAAVAFRDALVLIRERQAELSRVAFQRVQASESIGETGAQDSRTAELASARATAAAERARTDARIARLSLAARLGSPSGAIDWELQLDQPITKDVEEQDWVGHALTHRAIAQVAQALADAAVADAALTGSPFRNGLEGGLTAERDGVWSAGPALSAPLPLFDDGSATRAAAEARAIAAAHEWVRIQRTVIEEVRTAWAERRDAARSLHHWQAQVLPSQRFTLERTRLAAEAGESPLSAVLAAEDSLLEAEAESSFAEYSLRVAHARLVLAAGGNPQATRIIQ